MEMTQQIQLVANAATYKMIIPLEVEKKIRYICSRVWDTEWSGILFYDYTGSFETDDLTIICKDIFVMDIGNSTYTEFSMSPLVASYMADNMELFDCQMGLIHSHNNMSTFLSGTDQATLREEGVDRNNFVSLVVNNAGSYTAAITRKIESKKVVNESYSYQFFDKGDTKRNKFYEISSTIIEWFYLKIDKAETIDSFQDIQERLEEIKKEKEKPVEKIKPTAQTSIIPKNKPIEIKTKPNKIEEFEEMDGYVEDIPFGIVRFNEDKIKYLMLQLLTGCVLIKEDSNIDLNKFSSSMISTYNKRFKTATNFNAFAEMFCEYLVWNTTDEDLEQEGYADADIAAICAYDLIVELEKLPANIYISGYINALDKYIVY